MGEKPDDLTPENCQEAQQWMELIMRNQGLWQIPEQIFGYLNYETIETCRKVSELWNESLEKMALVKFLQEFGDIKDYPGDTIVSTIIPEWKKAVKMYGTKLSIEDLQEIKDSLGELLDETGKWKSCFLEPAHQAARIGALKFLKLLLSISFDMNSHDCIDRTVLAVACDHGQIECVKLLIDATNDLNARDMHGGTAFHWACRSGQAETVKFLIEISTKYGIDLNARDNDGIRALHWACQEPVPNTEETVKIMIELSTKYGIDLNVRDNNGKTPLHYACWDWNNPTYVMCLTNNGLHWSNIDLNDREHRVTKYHTEQRVRTEIVTMLLEYWRESGIDIIKAQDNEGQTALDFVNLRLQWKNDDPELNKVKTILEEEYAKIDAAEV